MKYLSLLMLVSTLGLGFEISSVKVGGDSQASVEFIGTGNRSIPTYKVNGNAIEVSFNNSNLSAIHQGKLDVNSPHALVQRVSLFEAEGKQVRAVIVVNGSLEGIKNRISVSEGATGATLKLDYPKVGNSTLDLLKEEQAPLQDLRSEVKKESRGFQWVQLVLFLVVVVGAGASTFFVVKFAKTKGNWGGSRKYLIEQLSYVPIGGTKSGVALVKVGSDFVLLGVTPNQVNFISNLPKLSAQYEEESSFEKTAFSEAVQEQIRGNKLTV